MTEVLHQKVRWLAASLHLAGLIWIPIYFVIHRPVLSITAQIWDAIYTTPPSQGAPGLREWSIPLVATFFTAPIVSIGLAIIAFINLLLSISLSSFIPFMLGVIGLKSDGSLALFGLLLALLLLLSHIALAGWGAVFAWKGQVYASPLTIKFLK